MRNTYILLLALWGVNDETTLPAAAEACREGLPHIAAVRLMVVDIEFDYVWRGGREGDWV